MKKGTKHSEESKRRISIIQIERYKDLINKKKISNGLKKKWKNKEYRLKRKISLDKALSNPKIKLKHKNNIKKALSNPEVRIKMRKIQKIIQNKKEVKLKKSISQKKAMANPKTRDKIRDSMIKVMSNPKVRINMSKHTKRNWKDKKFRTKLSNSLKMVWTDEYRLKKSNIMKDIWLDNEFRIKHREATIKAMSNPIIKKKHKDAVNTPEVRLKNKLSRAKQILPVKDTTIEVKIQNFLNQLDIDFFTHQYIKEIEHGYQCDILIPSMNLVIECDGDYWHKYPVGNDIDYIRIKELLDKGFKVLRLWEKEIRIMDISKFKNILITSGLK